MAGTADTVLIREVSLTRSVYYREVPRYVDANIVDASETRQQGQRVQDVLH